MNYLAYGLSQGMSGQNQGNQLINAMNTASLIQYRRDQQRLQNRYADIAQQNADLEWEKWGVESQKQELQLQAMQYELDNMKKSQAGKDFGFDFFNAMTSGNWGVVNNKLSNNQYINPIARQQNVANISDPRDYTPEALRKYGVEVPEGMDLNNYILVKGFDNSYRLVDKNQSAALVGVGNVVDSYTLEQAQTRTKIAQSRLQNQSLQTLSELGGNLQNIVSSLKGNATPEQIKGLSDIADSLYNLTDPTTKAVKAPTSSELKSQAANELQKMIENPQELTKDNFSKAVRLAVNGGTPDQIKTLGTHYSDMMFKEALAENPTLTFAQFQEKYPQYNQIINMMSQGLSKVQEDARKDTQKKNKEMADIINSFDDLITKEGLANLSKNQTWAKGSTILTDLSKKYVTPLMNMENIQVRQKTQGVFNTLLKLSSGLAVTKSELEAKIKELGDISTEDAKVVLSGFKNLAESLKARIQEAAGQDPISLLESKFKIRTLDNVIAQAESQLGLAPKNRDTASVKQGLDELYNQTVGGNQ